MSITDSELQAIAEHIATLANKVLKLEDKESEESIDFSKESQHTNAARRILSANLELMAECAKHAANMECILQTMENQRHEYATDMLLERLGLQEWGFVVRNPHRSGFLCARKW